MINKLSLKAKVIGISFLSASIALITVLSYLEHKENVQAIKIAEAKKNTKNL